MNLRGLLHAIPLLAGSVFLMGQSAGTMSYVYDSLGRVTSVTYSNGASITYAYDNAGNRTSQTIAGHAASYILTCSAVTGWTIPAHPVTGTYAYSPLGNCLDPWGYPLTVTAVTAPTTGTGQSSFTSTQIKFHPKVSTVPGTYTFTWTVTDSHANAVTASATVIYP